MGEIIHEAISLLIKGNDLIICELINCFPLCRYNLVFLGVTYLIPMMVMAVCYTLMGRKLWGSKSIGELTQYQKESMKSKRKVSAKI